MSVQILNKDHQAGLRTERAGACGQRIHTGFRIMGFVRRNTQMESYLIESGVGWSFLKDSEFNRVYRGIDQLIESKMHDQTNDDVFDKLSGQLPFEGYILSVPQRDHLLSIYECGVDVIPFGYSVKNIKELDRGKLDSMPSATVFTDSSFSFLCRLNLPWRDQCPEIYMGKNV